MSGWLIEGLKTGIHTTAYPAEAETAAGASPGLPVGGDYPSAGMEAMVARCPTHALSERDGKLVVDYRRCVNCFRCVRGIEPPLAWSYAYEVAAETSTGDPLHKLGKAFSKSVHIIVVDAGDCGACLNEVKQLTNPYYNMHRLGFFITPTPRHADVLLVVGPGTDQMRVALQKTYDAMPTPKRVVAVGACALSGSVFGPSFITGSGVRQIIPVDVEVPGQPPPPLAILHGLLVAVGRKASSSLESPTDLSSMAATTR